MHVTLPYGRTTVDVPLPPGADVVTCTPADLPGVRNPLAAVRAALANPLGSSRLRDLAGPGKTACIVVDDLSRPAPTALMLEAVLEELEAGGVARAEVSVLCAVGLHRALTEPELHLLAGAAARGVTLVNHDAGDPSQLAFLAETSLGTRVHLNRRFLEADLKILTGDVEYHQFVGYGGGAKSVYPGIADAEAIRLSHSRMELPGAAAGNVASNPVREEIEEVGRAAGVDFLLNVVLNSSREIVGAFGGDLLRAFRAATELVDAQFRLEVPAPVDAVLVSPGGHPRDLDLYQAQKSVSAAAKIVKPGGAVILVAEAPEGAGSALFVDWMTQAQSPDDVIRRLREQFVMGGHKAYQFAQAMSQASIYVYSSMPPEEVCALKMRALSSLNEVPRILAPGGTFAVLPQGTLSLPVLA